MRSLLHSLTAVLLLSTSALAQTGVYIEDQTDVEALRLFNLFLEGCVMGHIGRQGRLQTLDSHPMLRRIAAPPDSEAAKRGRLIWAGKDVFVVLEPDMWCRAVITSEAVKERLPKFIEKGSLGKSGDGKPTSFTPSNTLGEAELNQYRTRNIDIKTYLLRQDGADWGVILSFERSIDPSRGTYPARLSATYVSFDKQSNPTVDTDARQSGARGSP